jgi:hypothetical protein
MDQASITRHLKNVHVIPNLFRNLYFAFNMDAEPLQKDGGQASSA